MGLQYTAWQVSCGVCFECINVVCAEAVPVDPTQRCYCSYLGQSSPAPVNFWVLQPMRLHITCTSQCLNSTLAPEHAVLDRVELQLQGRALAAGTSNRQLSASVTLYQPNSSSDSFSGAGSIASSSSRTFESPEAAVEGATDLAAAAVQDAIQQYETAVAAAGSSSSSSLAGLTLHIPPQQQQQQRQPEEEEVGAGIFCTADLLLWHWLAFVKLEAACRQAVGQVAPLAGSGKLSQDFEVSG